MILVISVQLTGKRYTNEFGTDDVTALLTYSKPTMIRFHRSCSAIYDPLPTPIPSFRFVSSSWGTKFRLGPFFSFFFVFSRGIPESRLRVIENLNFSILCSKSKIIYRFDEKIQRKSSLEKDEIPALSLSLSIFLRCELSSRPRKYENKYVCRRRRRGGLEMKLK